MKRIALAGAGGTGKGTLGKMIAKHYMVPFLPSHIKDTGEMLGMNNYLDVPTADKAKAFQYAIMFGQIYQERALQIAGLGFVAERSTFDYIPYFLEKGLEDKYYLNVARNWPNDNYDGIIYLPVEFESPDATQNTWKERDPDKQERTSSIIIKEILEYYGQERTLVVTGSIEERFTKAINWIYQLPGNSVHVA